MPSTHRQTQTAERRTHVAQAYLKGAMQSEIARQVGVTQAQISMDLKAVRAAWLQSALRDFDAAKSIELAKIDLVELECWSAWERSKLPREVTTTEATEGGTRKATRRIEGSAGDPRFLERIQKCIDQRCQLLGIGAMQEAMKSAGVGLAALLEEARQQTVLPQAYISPPMAQA